MIGGLNPLLLFYVVVGIFAAIVYVVAINSKDQIQKP